MAHGNGFSPLKVGGKGTELKGEKPFCGGPEDQGDRDVGATRGGAEGLAAGVEGDVADAVLVPGQRPQRGGPARRTGRRRGRGSEG